VFVGGCIGGLARYGLTRAWPTPARGFPWATLVINASGAFALALLVVVVNEVLPPTTYVRPLLGTGFCGAWTTFSSVVVSTDQLIAHDHAATGVLYLVGSLGVGLGAALAGLATGRRLVQGPAARSSDGSS
jgi:CrcB protein